MTSTDSDSKAPVFWKTGTSHGFRDAWSVAVFDHYVLAVWVGNFDGRRNPAFIGRTCAAPLLFQMIDGLRANQHERAEPHLLSPGSNLKRVEFCAVYGQLPGPWCTHRTESWFIPGISPVTTCEVHREVFVDAATGLRVAQDDGTRAIKHEVYEFWSSDCSSSSSGREVRENCRRLICRTLRTKYWRALVTRRGSLRPRMKCLWLMERKAVPAFRSAPKPKPE